jgi:sorbitol/mannitol transport system substrate-binding protein
MVKGKIGYALSPTEVKKDTMTISTWGLGITSSSKQKDAAFKFITWASSKNYIKLVGENYGWARIPPATRKSTYKLSQYLAVAPFAQLTYDSLLRANMLHPAVDDTPYSGNSLLNMPEFPSFSEYASQELAAYLSNQKDLDTVIGDIQDNLQKVVTTGGYKNQ